MFLFFLFTKALLSVGNNLDVLRAFVQRCFRSTETMRTIRDGEPRTATSTFSFTLSS